MVGLLGVGMLLSSLPSGAIVARVGERGRCSPPAWSTRWRWWWPRPAPSVVLLAAAVVVSGMSWTMFLIARQGFMIDAVPMGYRARALSTLGGSHRWAC